MNDPQACWDPLDVPDLLMLLELVGARWWLSGGWSIDEFVTGGAPTRSHGDIDVSVPRSDWPMLWDGLRDRFAFRIAAAGRLDQVAGRDLAGDVRSIWARESDAGPWRLQINLEETDGDLWRYRRDPRVTRPIAELRWWSGRIWCVAPAVQLLWKAKAPASKDDHDLAIVLPRLPLSERVWLADAVRLAHPESAWVPRLEVTP